MASPLDGSNHDVAAGDTFPVKLYKLLHAAEQSGKTDIISWLGDGTKFKIHKKSEFASEIMPHFFSSSTYKSFQRSKNLWGFQTVSKGVHKGECSHPLFRRGDLNTCRKMVRKAKIEDGGGDLDPSEQASAGVPSTSTSHFGASSGLNASTLPQGGNTTIQQSLLDNLSGLNPSLLLAHQQQQQRQQQQFASLNSLLGNGSSTNQLLSALASLSNNSGNANILAALQQKMQAPPPVPSQPMSALQQLLQLAPQPSAQQPLNQQLLALLTMQQQQQPSAGTGLPDLSMLSAAAAATQGPPVASVAAPTQPPPLSAIDTSGKGSSKAKTKKSGKLKGSNKKAAAIGKTKAKSNVSSNTLREAALSRGSQVVACRARGMEMDHNMHTAFFEIPNDPDHGMDLVCSYPTCRNGGIKFLYCKYCDDVIAKRTFRAQHLHEDLAKAEAAGKRKGNAAVADISDDSNKRFEHAGEMPPKKRHKMGGSSIENGSKGENDELSGENVHAIDESTGSSSSSENDEEDHQGGKKGSGLTKEYLVDLRSQWDSLLDERQEMDSKDDISAWLDKVVETSEKFKKAARRSKKNAKQAEK